MYDRVSTGVAKTGGLHPLPLGMGGEAGQGVGSSKFDRGGLKSKHRGCMGELKVLSKNTSEGVH